MTNANEAHPIYNRELAAIDLDAMQAGSVVVDAYGIRWTKTARPSGIEQYPRWTSIVNPTPGVTAITLVIMAAPIRRDRRGPGTS